VTLTVAASVDVSIMWFPLHMLRRSVERLLLAARRPDLAWRRLVCLDAASIGLEEITPYLDESPVILEAGACNGSDTLRFAERWPNAEIHTFEPVPSSFALVEEKTRHLPQVHRYPLALADRSESRVMYVSEDAAGSHGSSSLLPAAGHLEEFPQVAFDELITVQAVTLQDWVTTSGIDRIDLMWLDLQGMELAVLQASPNVLATTCAVSMEVSRHELYMGCALYPEVISWMKSQGFEVAVDRVLVAFGNMLFVNRSLVPEPDALRRS
jgi:FkbM family methyltransferase